MTCVRGARSPRWALAGLAFISQPLGKAASGFGRPDRSSVVSGPKTARGAVSLAISVTGCTIGWRRRRASPCSRSISISTGGFLRAKYRLGDSPTWAGLGYAFAATRISFVDLGRFEDTKTVVTGGVGFRYEIARRYGIHAGVDLAVGPDTTAVLQVGSAWTRP